jgi:hypothetical protein
MMYKVMLGLVATAALGVGTSSSSKAPRQEDPAVEIADLKRQVARLSADVNLLKQAAGGGESDKEKQVVAYIEAQARAAGELERVLAQSEEQGFTYGINPESREVLLAGFHKFAATLQDNVPGSKPAAPAAR